MEFCWVTLHVNNLNASMDFYQGILGLPVAERFSAGEGREIVMLGETDKPKVELIYDLGSDDTVKTSGLSIGFEVDSLDAAMEYVKEKGLDIKSGPFSPDPSISFFFISDPDGIDVQLVEKK